jgi:hypothetical protein
MRYISLITYRNLFKKRISEWKKEKGVEHEKKWEYKNV